MKLRLIGLLAALFTVGALVASPAFAATGDPSSAATADPCAGVAPNPAAMHGLTSPQDMQTYFCQAKILVDSFDDTHGLPRSQWVFVGPNEFCNTCGFLPVPSAMLYMHSYYDNKTYVGADMMFEMYQKSWAMPVIAMAHEDGHDNQEANGMDLNLINGPADVLKGENQADCFSGVFANWAAPQVGANVWADAPGVMLGWSDLSSPNTPQRDHGYSLERQTEFGLGYITNDLHACDPIGFVPVS